VRINKSGCLDQCEHGPTVVVYPEAVWYGNVKPEDAAAIVEEHLVGGRPVERLRLADECVNTKSCPHRGRRLVADLILALDDQFGEWVNLNPQTDFSIGHDPYLQADLCMAKDMIMRESSIQN